MSERRKAIPRADFSAEPRSPPVPAARIRPQGTRPWLASWMSAKPSRAAATTNLHNEVR